MEGTKMGAKEKAVNEAQNLKGKAKEAAAKVSGNNDLETDGKFHQAKASAKGAGEKVKDAASKVKDSIKRK
jgi:uncharacterized protein YjbJ (UPF0337 family)